MSKLIYVDRKFKFLEQFDSSSGFYMRTGIIDKSGNDTNVDPFMRSYPQILDIGVCGVCKSGKAGVCKAGGIGCYQSGGSKEMPDMSVEDFKSIIEESKHKTFQVALGGRGDPDGHDHFEELLKICRENDIVPNFTTSGLLMTEEKAEICKKYVGAVAVSWQRGPHTAKALGMFIKAGVRTNIHYVLGNNSIDEAIGRLSGFYSDYKNGFPDGINAVVFLLHKPVGCGAQDNVLNINDERVATFFSLVNKASYPFQLGFDACSIPALVNFCPDVDENAYDTCEGGRFSMYISSDMKALPCSFDQDYKWAVDLKNNTITEAWNSQAFGDFRDKLKTSCSSCSKQSICMGGCPIKREIVLCNRGEKDRK